MKNLLLLLLPFLFTGNSFSQISYWENTFPTNYTVVSVLGAGNIVEGTSITKPTAGCFASGYANTIMDSANSSHAFGGHTKVGGMASFALGERIEATKNNSYAIGSYLKATANNAMVIGSGYWSSGLNTNLVNDTANSLMIGFNSQSPTLFIGPASGENTIGKVGIGTTYIPSGYLFAVKGSMIAEMIKVQVYSEWPDYVFNKKYELLPLEKVEEFIKKNSHLPNVPCESDLKEDGYDVAEMDAILLKKIEELTLYLIELKKENDGLKQEILNKR